MTIHKHANQPFLNRLGSVVDNNYAYLTYAGNQPDGRTWSRDKGVCLADGTPVNMEQDADGRLVPLVQSVRFSPMRVAPNGSVYCRELIYDTTGMLVQITAEKLLAKPTGTSIFQQYGPDAIIPIAGMEMGATDEFFTRDGRGIIANTDFPEDAETVFMKASGPDIQLRPLEGAIPAPSAWDDVDASFIGPLYCMATTERLTGREYGSMPLPDGVPLALNMRVLIDQQLRPSENGIYSLTRVGGAAETWELTRTEDADTPEKFQYEKSVKIVGGQIRAGQEMYLSSHVTAIGQSDITFSAK